MMKEMNARIVWIQSQKKIFFGWTQKKTNKQRQNDKYNEEKKRIHDIMRQEKNFGFLLFYFFRIKKNFDN